MSKVKSIIRKIFGHSIVINPIFDKIDYQKISNGFAGGSLFDSNMLVISNRDIKVELNEIFAKERCHFQFIITPNIINLGDLKKANQKFVGGIDHIINIFFFSREYNLLADEYNKTDIIDVFYNTLKEESDYLVTSNIESSLCNVYIGDGSDNSDIEAASIKACVEGLGKPLGNHHLICNGLEVNRNVPLVDVANMAVYMSSKYGQILAGQMIRMNSGIL